MESEHQSILVMIVDCDPKAWSIRSDNNNIANNNLIKLDDYIRSIVFFISSYCLLHRYNQVVIIANHPQNPKILYPRRDNDDNCKDNFVPTMHLLPSIIAQGILSATQDIASLKSDNTNEKKSSLSQCLSLSLCMISKQLKKFSKLQPRILISQVTKDDSTTYNAVMNSIFSAQRYILLLLSSLVLINIVIIIKK